MLLALLISVFALIICIAIYFAVRGHELAPVRHAHFVEPSRVWVDAHHPPPTPGWVVFEAASPAIAYIERFPIKELSLDYELGRARNGTGLDVLKAVERRIEQGQAVPAEIHIHTRNAFGHGLMEQSLRRIHAHMLERDEQYARPLMIGYQENS